MAYFRRLTLMQKWLDLRPVTAGRWLTVNGNAAQIIKSNANGDLKIPYSKTLALKEAFMPAKFCLGSLQI